MTIPSVNPGTLATTPTGSIIHTDRYPFIDLSILCVPIPEMPRDLCLTFPGGFDVCALSGAIPIGGFEAVQNILTSASTAMAPLGPIFKIIEAINSIMKCFTAVLDALGPPPDPTKLKAVVKDLEEKVIALAKLSPVLSIPLLVLQLIDVLIAFTDSLASELTSIARYVKAIQDAQFAAAQAPSLAAIIKCARSNYETQMSNVERAFASVNPIINVINVFCQLAKLKPIAQFEGQLPPEPLVAAATIKSSADKLRALRALIPI